jgi:predicted nucleic acid-binding protein
MMRVLLDSDVILDLILERKPHFDDAHLIFKAIARREFEPYVTSIAILNVNYFVEKERGREFALIEIAKLLNLLDVCVTTKSMLVNSLKSPITDYEDAVQSASAMAEGLDAIVSRNTKDFEKSPIRVFSPSEFLHILDNSIAEGNER